MSLVFNRLPLAVFLIGLTLCLGSDGVARPRVGGTQDIEATAVTKNSIASVRLYDLENRTITFFGVPTMLVRHYAIVVFSDPQDNDTTDTTSQAKTDLDPANITIKFIPSGKVVPQAAIVVGGDTKNLGGTNNFKLVQIVLNDDPGSRPEPGDDQVEVTFNRVHFEPATEVKGVKGSGTIVNRGNIAKRIEQDYEALKKSVAHANTDEEKDAFIGVDVVVPSGGGDSQGSGDISFNKDLRPATLGQAALFNHIIFGFKLKKASEEKSDPRHFEIGLNFRKSFLNLNQADLLDITSAIVGSRDPNSAEGKKQEEKALEAITKLQKNFIRAYIWDNALRFEGDVSDRGISNVSNLLWDSQLQVATVSRAFAGQTGFWNFRWVPVGVEVGGNLTNNDDPTQAKRSLARLKSGGELNLIFKAANPDEPISRITLTAKALERYLFKDEATLDEMTKKVVMTDKGSKYWLQADLKVSTGIKVGVGRVGFKLTFQRGFLPPAYAFVKTFKFGVVFETNDDDNSGNTKVQ